MVNDMHDIENANVIEDIYRKFKSDKLIVYDEDLLNKYIKDIRMLSFSRGFIVATIFNAVICSFIFYLQ